MKLVSHTEFNFADQCTFLNTFFLGNIWVGVWYFVDQLFVHFLPVEKSNTRSEQIPRMGIAAGETASLNQELIGVVNAQVPITHVESAAQPSVGTQ